ncbi:general secretion pathway protein GspB [Allohahella sp. A8]|uniref:general secretion pathway protein GspB n=1 Tax=Allohahella sp. A8 TaxID=3141461 RepID=UPI0026A0F3F3|tara:strand:- start:180790 stop:181218 length:429 start_codon:yes stop_codon:yes gene_type:complete
MSITCHLYRSLFSVKALLLAAATGLLTQSVLAASANPPASMTIDGIEISDPTRPLDWRTGPRTASPQDQQRPELKVSSILISPARRLAIINGRSVAEGSTINGVKVQRVSADGVQLRWQGEQWTARLAASGNAVRQPVRTQP